MQKNLLMLSAAFIGIAATAQDNLHVTSKKLDKTYITDNKRLPDLQYQYKLRQQKPWQDFLAENGVWYVTFNEDNGRPHSAYGQPINVSGGTPEFKVRNFIDTKLAGFNIPSEDLVLNNVGETSKHLFVTLNQKYQGLDVLFGKFTAKLTHDSKLISWGADVYTDITLSTTPSIDEQAAISAASIDITESIKNISVNSSLKVLPIPYFKSMKYKLVYEVKVETMGASRVPSNWFTWVDANTGEVVYRQNLVLHCSDGTCNHKDETHGKDAFKKKIAASKLVLPPGDIELNVEATIYENNPDIAAIPMSIANLDLTVGGTAYQTDGSGFISTSETGTQNAVLSLEGQWGKVINNGTTPSFTTLVTDGVPTTVSWDGNASLEELCSYNNVNAIHDYHKTILLTQTTAS